jgi:hypothetical protein
VSGQRRIRRVSRRQTPTRTHELRQRLPGPTRRLRRTPARCRACAPCTCRPAKRASASDGKGEFCALELDDGSLGLSYVLLDDTLARLRRRRRLSA